MDANRMPGDAEAAGAAAGMSDLYGCTLPEIGERVAYRLQGWSDRSFDAAKVIGHLHAEGSTTVLIELDDGSGLRVIDARPWPTGNLLPF